MKRGGTNQIENIQGKENMSQMNKTKTKWASIYNPCSAHHKGASFHVPFSLFKMSFPTRQTILFVQLPFYAFDFCGGSETAGSLSSIRHREFCWSRIRTFSSTKSGPWSFLLFSFLQLCLWIISVATHLTHTRVHKRSVSVTKPPSCASMPPL